MSLDLSGLLGLIGEMPAYRRLIAELVAPKGDTRVVVTTAARPYLMAAIYNRLHLPMLVITSQPQGSKQLWEQLSIWCPSAGVKLLPEGELLPYQGAIPDSSVALERIQVLSALALNGQLDGPAPLVVASAPALMQKVPSYSDFTSCWHTVKLGMEVAPIELLGRWSAMGYRTEAIVEVPGTLSHRGGIVDIYPATSELPLRLEFFGNIVDSIRLFDPRSQRSLKAVPSVTVGPASEILAPFLAHKSGLAPLLEAVDLSNCTPDVRRRLEQGLAMLGEGQRPDDLGFYAPLFNRDSILSYLPKGGLVVVDEAAAIAPAVEHLDGEASGARRSHLEGGELPANFPTPYFTWPELEARLGQKRCLVLASWGDDDERAHRLNFTASPSYAGRLPLFFKKAKGLLKRKHRLILSSHQASRLSELLAEEGIVASPLTGIREVPPPGSLRLVQGLLSQGWVMNGNTHLFTDSELFGFLKQRRLSKKLAVASGRLTVPVSPGDYVVHVDHGVARFAGVTAMSAADTKGEYLVLEYAAGDRLYVPTDQIDRIGRYQGAGGRPPLLGRLGTQEWARAKQKAREAAASIAGELLALYAAREVIAGFAFSEDTLWQQELEASFPYVETPDQLTVQKEVKEDMEKAKPMDRFILGDVGYGKTEVALRAAFKAVMDGKQVAVLVPTTVLAQQHFTSFSQRLSAFPLRVEVLSRFKTPREQRAVLDGLAGGSVDICIGTHRLLQKDVVFKDLGLLIIDEEQRFGVAHKEYLKKMRREVDVLSLSATPIPRTLHMSLTGVRDMSVMETPPEERLPVRTYVAAYDERLVREAILRELERNGQVFFVHNRVQSIGVVLDKLQALVPEAVVAVAHGQLPEGELEVMMADFVAGRVDVLVCTTIIESGLDVPNANTLIINQADRFGLTQLYQLRGRVGRGVNMAYAYLLYEKDKRLTADAAERLRTMFEATELGAGFGIAMKDLEIRGAGTLLGVKQSGHINAVGFSLYTQLLAEAVEEQKAVRAGKSLEEIKSSRMPPPSINLPLQAFIPEPYVPDLNTRLGLYQRLAGLKNVAAVAEMAADFKDRFGALPAEVKNLLYMVRIKILSARAGVGVVSTEHGQIVIRLLEGLTLAQQKLEPVLREGIKPGRTQLRLDLKRLGKKWPKVLEEVLEKMG